MKCLSCFSDITSEYKLSWNVYPYCNKCNIICISLEKFLYNIHNILNLYFFIKNRHDLLIYNDILMHLEKIFNINKNKYIKYEQKECHLSCNKNKLAICNYLICKDTFHNFTLYICPIDNYVMFNPDEIINVIKNQISISSKKKFIFNRLLDKFRGKNDFK